MQVFTRHTKVIGVAKHELEAIADMVREASTAGKAERRMSDRDYLAIEVKDSYAAVEPHMMPKQQHK